MFLNTVVKGLGFVCHRGKPSDSNCPLEYTFILEPHADLPPQCQGALTAQATVVG